MNIKDLIFMPHQCRSARLASVLFATALVGGCANLTVMSHVPLSTMSRLSSLKLSEIEPTELRVAASLPEALEPRPLGVKVRIDVAGQNHGKLAEAEFTLEPAVEPSELTPLSLYRRAGYQVWVYRLSSHDGDRLKHLIDESGGASGVSIAAGVDACHHKPYGSVALLTTTFLRTNGTGFFVLTQDLDLRSIVSEQELASRVPPCA
jgi:hypothetical protein